MLINQLITGGPHIVVMIGHWDAGPWVDPKRRLSPGTGKRNNSGGFGAAEGAKKKTSDGERKVKSLR